LVNSDSKVDASTFHIPFVDEVVEWCSELRVVGSTLASLVEVLRDFFKASHTNTLYTALIQTGNCDTEKAL